MQYIAWSYAVRIFLTEESCAYASRVEEGDLVLVDFQYRIGADLLRRAGRWVDADFGEVGGFKT
jgi:hypothetical protein